VPALRRDPTERGDFNPREKVVRAILIGAFLALSGCSTYGVDPGHELVLVRKPWFFGHGGVDSEPVKTGRVFTALSTEGIDVNMQPQRVDIQQDDTMTKDGVPVSFHAVATLQVTDSVALVKNFGPNWYQNNLFQPFSTAIRQAVRKRGMNETAIEATAIDAIDEEIRQTVVAFIAEEKLPVKVVAMSVGRANPPDSVKNQRIETAAQQQRVLTEGQRKLAEDARLQAEQSRAAADNAYREAMKLSPEQFLQLETIKMQHAVCGPEGKAQCTFIQNGTTPVLNLGK
jgi:regulator of protease activity HflC (stomatin/prohibitin superfamily)